MADLFLKYQYTDRDGHDIFNIIDNDDDSNLVLGSLRMKYGKDDGYSNSGIRVQWAEEVDDPDATALTGSR